MSGEFCVVCGRTDVPLEEGVCPDCFAARHVLVDAPGRPTVVLCPTCGARKVGEHWERAGASPTLLAAEDLTPLLRIFPEVAVRRVRWQEVSEDKILREYHGEADVRFRGTERTVAFALRLKVQHRTCPECSRLSGRFFTAILQLRGPEGRQRLPPRELRAALGSPFDSIVAETPKAWRQALSWKEALPEGWDYYLTDTTSARALARHLKVRLGATLSESATLWGRKDGRDVYRVTFCLRLPVGTRRRPATAGGAEDGDGRPAPRRVERHA